jgi:sugar (pentulose or hexulose) kinase
MYYNGFQKKSCVNLDSEEKFQSLFDDVIQPQSGAEGLIFLPYIAERSPMWDENERSIHRFTLRTTRGQQSRSKGSLCLFDVLHAVETRGRGWKEFI